MTKRDHAAGPYPEKVLVCTHVGLTEHERDLIRMNVFHKHEALDRGLVILRYTRQEKSIDVQVPGNTNISGRFHENGFVEGEAK